jgi:hypothetical protein
VRLDETRNLAATVIKCGGTLDYHRIKARFNLLGKPLEETD